MSPYDMLRSILRDEKTDEELEKVLEMNGFDLSQTIMALTETQAFDTPQAGSSFTGQERTFLVGKSMSPTFRPATPAGQAKSGVVCRYWLANGNCARADCRFSHDLSNHICKYWLMGNCLAGEGCIFSHDPSALINRLLIDGGSTPPTQYVQPNLQLQDYDSFPALHPVDSDPYQQSFDPSGFEAFYGANVTAAPPPGLSPFPPEFIPNGSSLSRPQSRPTSQYQSRAPTPAAPALDDNEAFPTLGSAAAKPGKRHHGKRGGHGHGHKDNGPSSLADLVRMSPSPSVTPLRRGLKSSKSYTGSRENSAAAQAIPAPEHVPWLETGDNTNKAYLRARSEAFKHGGLRNKFLQSAAQAWNRNDSRGAKALSLRGQNENNLMREAHREAARCLYEERNKNAATSKELYVDLHGLHPEEAVSYLERCLFEQQSSARPVYAITGTGHHSKNGKDKVGKSIRTFLNEWRYAFREFSVPGDRNNVGGILGFDPTSFERDALKKAGSGGAGEVDKENTGEVNDSSGLGKVRLVKAEEVDIPRGPRRRL
ncbi:hypothetical protein LTR39_000544 [Cryomyces antarcticus]|nr:hypothetical protein LTR39_000544 [Cryomyces antarcticus]